MKQRDILNFWRNVEVFNLPDFNKECFPLLPGSSFPWQSKRPLRNPKVNVWRYTLLFGKIPKKEVVDAIDGLLKVRETQMDWEEPITGDTCFSALLLDEQGQVDHKSYIPAAFIMGINCLEADVSMAAVSEKIAEAQSAFEIRYNIPPFIDQEADRKGVSVTWQHLQQEVRFLNSVTKGWSNTPIEVFAIAREVPRDAEPDTSFLNSFFLDDLTMLIGQGEQSYGAALSNYLNIAADPGKREDLITNRTLLCSSIDPGLMPIGRWPAKTAHGLYTAQSGAVGTIIGDLRKTAGIKGINGPPGAGKTTLLLDIIADVVVARAQMLMQAGPDNLFGRYTKIEREDGFSGYFGLTSVSLCDSGIVVASNNNAAVENITKALPSIDKIDRSEFDDADYFAIYAQRLIEGDSWGVLSAALGNAQNRSNFKWNFWLGSPEKGITGFQDMLWNVYKDSDNDQTFTYRQKFEDTQQELKVLLARFDSFKQKASHFHNQYSTNQRNKTKKSRLEDDLRKTEAAILRLSDEESVCKKRIEETQELIHLSETILTHIKEQKPSFFFFQKLFNTSAYSKWKVGYDHNITQIQEHLDKRTSLAQQFNRIGSELAANTNTAASLVTQQAEVNKTIAQYFAWKEELHRQYGIHNADIVDEDFYNATLDEVQLRTPYSSALVNKLRSDIFLKSLELHQYCILANAKKVRNNLNLFFEMMEGRAQVEASLATTLWGTLFLCVPVISTTLASASRLFASMGRESLGWLLLDEAGQATPQSAAGMIWRSKRCIVVGDPLQIEPVITIPGKLISKLRQQEEVGQVWSPLGSSVQILADRVSQKGTYMLTGESDEKVWTGFPLRTHRRCSSPMFEIANKIAYSGQMVKATKDADVGGFIGPSAWFHISASSPPVNRHVLVEELDVLKGKIEALRRSGYRGEIFVISPFKSVANACESVCKGADNISCGTIHRFQGKEADVVFLVLGGNPASQGARDWASKKPNMLNVAVTRAKKRFYVIGNRNLWGSCRYFSELAARLNEGYSLPLA